MAKEKKTNQSNGKGDRNRVIKKDLTKTGIKFLKKN